VVGKNSLPGSNLRRQAVPIYTGGMNRSGDWMAQADRDLDHARHALDAKDFEWAAFAAQQAAEKALKALALSLGGEPWGHSLTALAEALPARVRPDEELLDCAKHLDKHYIPARYPNGFDSGYPGKLYTASEARSAIADATKIIAHCRDHLV